MHSILFANCNLYFLSDIKTQLTVCKSLKLFKYSNIFDNFLKRKIFKSLYIVYIYCEEKLYVFFSVFLLNVDLFEAIKHHNGNKKLCFINYIYILFILLVKLNDWLLILLSFLFY